MTAFSFRSSKSNHWVQPRPSRDPHLRLLNYGPIQPMERPRKSLLGKIFGGRA